MIYPPKEQIIPIKDPPKDPSQMKVGKIEFGPESKDPWKHRSTMMKCKTCMYYVQKKTVSPNTVEIGRCRANAPTMKGYPAVFPHDWCGNHKCDETKLLLG